MLLRFVERMLRNFAACVAWAMVVVGVVYGFVAAFSAMGFPLAVAWFFGLVITGACAVCAAVDASDCA